MDELDLIEQQLRTTTEWYDRHGWNMTSVSGAKKLAKELNIKNVSAFVNQIPHLRALAALGKYKELEEELARLQRSITKTCYPNSHSYMGATVNTEHS